MMRKEESESGQWLELHKENWRWAEGDGTAARTDRPRDGAGHEGRTTVVTPPAGAWDVWTMRREEMKRDAEMRTEHGRMVDGLETAMRMTGEDTGATCGGEGVQRGMDCGEDGTAAMEASAG